MELIGLRNCNRAADAVTAGQNIALVIDFVDKHILGSGMVADWVYHDNPVNPPIRIVTPLRPLTEDIARRVDGR